MMNAIITCLAACLLHVVCSTPTSLSWCYHRRSCSYVTWPTIAEKYCNGTRQSPINIVTANVQANANLTSLIFTGYSDKAALTEIKNTGMTIQVTLDHKKMRVEGGDLPGLFASTEFHLHWGNGSTTPGSEHSVNGKRFPMELHIVNKAERNASVPGDSALAVLGVFIEASNDTGKPESWNTLTSSLTKIANAGDQARISDSISMDDLLPGVERSKYYRYVGSMTTPNCNEGVIWTIFKDPIKVSRDLIDLFTTSVYINKTANSPLIINTFRGVQPINGRVVMSQVEGTKTTRPIQPTSSTKTTGLLGIKTTSLIKPTSRTKTTGLITPTASIKTTSLIKPTSAATNLSQALISPLLSVVLLYCILPLL
ncbi:carbonic anhydrase 4-like [Labeo rohita]|uniref:carbonic anhydrase 4-like n=1 Tax=Labeo rohita TaxID=84645 RepID=UPI0021E2CC80|nr:carbonic anhydrase 4-like [Labeo rohita]